MVCCEGFEIKREKITNTSIYFFLNIGVAGLGIYIIDSLSKPITP